MPEHLLTAGQVIQALGLEPLLAEGGLYRETYRSGELVPPAGLPERYPREARPFGTAIFYLLTGEPGSFSALHRLPTDEVYHCYLGDPLEMTLLYPNGESQQVILGQALLEGQRLQLTVPRGVWQGSRLMRGERFALLGTTMAPGFVPSDYEGGQRDALLAAYPHERERILALTR
jgi:predicted cupin superfamily sugar epimerase